MSIDLDSIKSRLASGAGGYGVAHASPRTGAEHRFIGYGNLSVLVVFARAQEAGAG
jgi:hypothetical protein